MLSRILGFASLLITFAATAFAQNMPFEGMGQLPTKSKLEYSGWHEPIETMNYNRVGLSVPVDRTEQRALSLSARYSQLNLPPGIELPASAGVRVPSTLLSAEVGLGYTHKLEENRTTGGGVTYGSASDELFRSSDVTTQSANYYYSFPAEGEDRWILALFYSNNNPVLKDIPIPGFAYFFKKPTVTGAVGIPFLFLRWTPQDPWAVTVFSMATILRTELSHGPFYFQKFIGFDSNQQTWLLHARENKDAKLYFAEKRVYAGLRFPLAQGVFTEFQVGQAFDRSFYMAEGFASKTTEDANLPASGYASWNFKFEL